MSNLQRWTDEWNQGSFVSPVPAPNSEPDISPFVCIQFAEAWLPYVLGSLFQLVQPSAYEPGSTGYADAVAQAQGLMAIFSEAGGCADMLAFQCDPTTGDPQYSTDGGVTWTDLPGCFIGPEGPQGPQGPTGATGGFTPGTPIAQPGQTTPQLACSIAGYLATQLIQSSLASVVSAISGAQTVLSFVTGLVALIPGVDVVFVAVTAAGSALFDVVFHGTLTDYEDALTDSTLWSDVACAIYDAIITDGYVTDANFPDILTNLAAISYAHADVVTAIHDYVQDMGATGLEAVQIPGALAVVDCGGCGTWCYEWDLTTSLGPWVPVVGRGTWVSGVGLVSQLISGVQSAECDITPGSAINVTGCQITYINTAALNSRGAAISTVGSLGGVVHSNGDTTVYPSPHVAALSAVEPAMTLGEVNLATAGSGGTITILAVQLSGLGANPFGPDNC